MVRALRHFVPGEIYHIIQRGHNRAFVFDGQENKRKFVDVVRRTQEYCSFHILYYVIMSNHYHFVIEVGDTPIEKAMKRINLAYCKYYNQKYGCSGTIYGGRYHDFAVRNTRQLVRLMLYIANNPVRAGMVRNPSEYEWCAHHEIVMLSKELWAEGCHEISNGRKAEAAVPNAASVITQTRGILSIRRLFDRLGDGLGSGGLYESGKDMYDGLISQQFDVASRAPDHKAFVAESRIVHLDALLHEFLDAIAGDSIIGHTAECAGSRTEVGQINAAVNERLNDEKRRAFIQLATEQGYKTAEIATVLKANARAVRDCRRELAKSKWCQTPEFTPEDSSGWVEKFPSRVE